MRAARLFVAPGKPARIGKMLVIVAREIDKGRGGQLPMYVPLESTISDSGESFWPTSQWSPLYRRGTDLPACPQRRGRRSRVWRQASKASSVARVIVATDDERIAAPVRAAGGEAIMTSPAHQSGTDRIA